LAHKKSIRGSLNEGKRLVFLILGIGFVAIGILGLLLPLLPGTIFLILAAACFARSSPRAYNWLTTNKFFGTELHAFLEKRQMKTKAKIQAITILGIGITASIIFSDIPLWGGMLVLTIGLGVTSYLIGLKPQPKQSTNHSY
jgi:uncharacterized membrane protein YbaN (DUF454 family)